MSIFERFIARFSNMLTVPLRLWQGGLDGTHVSSMPSVVGQTNIVKPDIVLHMDTWANVNMFQLPETSQENIKVISC